MKKRKIKWRNIVFLSIIVICTTGLIISLKNIIKWKIDSNSINNQINKINKVVEISESSEDNVEIIEQEEVKEFDPYLDYIKMNLLSVDFKELKKMNSDTKGWIKVNGTDINYPFVQALDNDYYLYRSFDETYNSGGWVFLDYRNDINKLDKNTIIYAHSRLDKTMFWSLRNVFSKSWQKNKDNYVVKLSTEKYNTLWQVFSIYHIPTTSDYIKVDFDTLDEFEIWTNKLLNRSFYRFNTKVSKDDKILTLSSCYSEDEKMVLHAKLIKKEVR